MVLWATRGSKKGERGRGQKKRKKKEADRSCNSGSSSIAAVLYNGSGSVVEPQCLDYQSKHEILGC